MNEKAALHGLACPNCGGMVAIPEGQIIIRCPHCDIRSMVRGERGLLRYQVPLAVDREQARLAVQRFLRSNRAIASQAAKAHQITESFVAYLPFWLNWSHVLGWVFGEKKVGSGDDARYEPREVKFSQEMHWTGAAAEVAEFGVDWVSLNTADLELFDADQLHSQGMVFEPMGSFSEARSLSEQEFHDRVMEKANLDRVSQRIIRFIDQRMGLVYFPLWVMRYRYRGRTYQVVVDGATNKILYGKAPGNTLYRAATLVGGMALGAFLVVDVSSLVVWFAIQSEGDSIFTLLLLGLGVVGVGFGIMVGAYRRFRHGEEFEFRTLRRKRPSQLINLASKIWKQVR
jgi:hypothetical protein